MFSVPQAVYFFMQGTKRQERELEGQKRTTHLRLRNIKRTYQLTHSFLFEELVGFCLGISAAVLATVL